MEVYLRRWSRLWKIAKRSTTFKRYPFFSFIFHTTTRSTRISFYSTNRKKEQRSDLSLSKTNCGKYQHSMSNTSVHSPRIWCQTGRPCSILVSSILVGSNIRDQCIFTKKDEWFIVSLWRVHEIPSFLVGAVAVYS